MIMKMRLVLAALAFVLAAAAAPAARSGIPFITSLRGDNATTNTGSKATGRAILIVHDDTQTVDITLTVSGLSLNDLSEHLTHAPVGPVHLHVYATNGDSSLILPFPMGPSYAATSTGFVLSVTNYPYAEGAKIIASDITFDGFVNALQSGTVVLNIHSEKFPDGEISGKVGPAIFVPAPRTRGK
jgi:hypothetical protein